MAKYKRYDYSQSMLIPVFFEEQLMPVTLEFAINTLVETRMDMSIFDDNYHNDQPGRRAYDPKILLKVILIAYWRGLISSRKIERACRENVTFMALSGNQRPDHSTIAAFVSCMKDEILPLFRDILLICEQENLLGGTFFALDGVKLPGTADTNYHNQSTLEKCQEETLDAYIPDLKFRSRDPRFADQPRYQPKKGKKFVLQNFNYIEAEDCYICPNGKILKINVKRHISDRNIYRRYMADAKDCSQCSLKSRCFYRKNTKRRTLDVPIGAEENNFSKAMLEKVDSEKGRQIYPQRMAIVEPVFANIRTQKRMDSFTLRGKIKVNIQWMLYCMVHNIEKIMNFAAA